MRTALRRNDSHHSGLSHASTSFEEDRERIAELEAMLARATSHDRLDDARRIAELEQQLANREREVETLQPVKNEKQSTIR